TLRSLWKPADQEPQRAAEGDDDYLADSGGQGRVRHRHQARCRRPRPLRSDRTPLSKLTLYIMIGPLPYIGGKNRLAAKIIALLPEHTTYVEPFAGGAQVFFHKQPAKVEVLNDLNGEIVNFFRVCQWHHEELVRYLRYCLMSRKLYETLAATN